ncbi:MAG: hypothetical protein QE487_14400 [Fluviicola sp.]|nr:hypothetical protein [Fluviicola sp.]
MKTILVILGLVTTQLSLSQQLFDWKSLLNHGSTAKLNELLDSIDLGERGNLFDYYNRTLTTSFNERIIYLEDSYGFDSTNLSWHINAYRISIIQSNDSIVFAKVDTIASAFEFDKKVNHPVFEFKSKEKMKKVEDEFRQIYHTMLQWDELFNTSIEFGLRCGRTGWNTDEYSDVSELVMKSRINKLGKYLTSTCLEKQLYGIQGFFELKEKGYKIKPSHKALIEVILAKDGEVIFCSGCVIQRTEMSHFREKFNF